MSKQELEELKLRIAKEMDVLQFLDVLGFDMFDLVDILEEEIEGSKEDFERVL